MKQHDWHKQQPSSKWWIVCTVLIQNRLNFYLEATIDSFDIKLFLLQNGKNTVLEELFPMHNLYPGLVHHQYSVTALMTVVVCGLVSVNAFPHTVCKELVLVTLVCQAWLVVTENVSNLHVCIIQQDKCWVKCSVSQAQEISFPKCVNIWTFHAATWKEQRISRFTRLFNRQFIAPS